jgi:hypothetical protein
MIGIRTTTTNDYTPTVEIEDDSEAYHSNEVICHHSGLFW